MKTNPLLRWSGYHTAATVLTAGLALQQYLRQRRIRTYNLRSKVVAITGGSRGLGLELARQMARQSAKLALLARDNDELILAANQLRTYGNPVQTYVCDITDEQAVNHTIPQIVAHFGRLDVLVNNAGIIQVGPQQELTIADYEEAMATHYWGALYAIRAALPALQKRANVVGEARIVNISSIGGKIPVPHLSSYVGSKYALVGLSQSLHTELAGSGIRVTTVTPTLMRTGSPRQAQIRGQHEKEYLLFKTLGSLPMTSISMEDAAREIITALRAGDAEVAPGWQAKVLVRLNGLMPGLFQNIAGLAAQLLPGPGQEGRKLLGIEIERRSPRLTRNWLTRGQDAAVQAGNQLA